MYNLINNNVFDSKIHTNRIDKKEMYLGYFLGPIGVILMNAILSSYLNVYYTDVLNINHIWDGIFISAFPVTAKILDVLTYILMGKIIDCRHSKQGKARPWILISAPLLVLGMILLFAVPDINDAVTAMWIFASYILFYAVAYTMYSTAHTLLVPLATYDKAEREKLSLISNTPNMVAGTLVSIIFPCFVLPLIGIHRNLWITVMLSVAMVAFPVILLEYYFTKERVTKTEHQLSDSRALSLKKQLKCCMKSKNWIVLMIYLFLINLVNSLFNISSFYYCNWVLGTYNDGYTQTLFFALGQAPLGIGIIFCRPICRKFGTRNAMILGFALSTAGVLLCLLNPRNLIQILTGQVIRTIGLIPSTFMGADLLGNALDDVEQTSGKRCDGFTSSILNCIVTITSGLATCIFNYGISHLGYQTPDISCIPVQVPAVQTFIIVCVISMQIIVYPVIMVLLLFFRDRRNAVPQNLG